MYKTVYKSVYTKCRGKFAGVIYQRALLNKEGVKHFCFSLKSLT